MEVAENSAIIYTKNRKTKSINSMYQFIYQKRNIIEEKTRISIITFLRNALSNKRKIYVEQKFDKLKEEIEKIYFKNIDFIKELDLVCDNPNIEIILENCNFYSNNIKIKGGNIKIINPIFKDKSTKKKITVNNCESVYIELNEEDSYIEVTQSNKVTLDVKKKIKDLFISANIICLKNIQKVDYMYLNGKQEISFDNCNISVETNKLIFTLKIFLNNSKLIGTFNKKIEEVSFVLKNSFIKATNKINIINYLLDEKSFIEDSEFIIKRKVRRSKQQCTEEEILLITSYFNSNYCSKIYKKLDKIKAKNFMEVPKVKKLTRKNKKGE